MPQWRVDIIRKRAEHLGTVEAPNASEAILEAIKRFEIRLSGAIELQCRRWGRRRIGLGNTAGALSPEGVRLAGISYAPNFR